MREICECGRHHCSNEKHSARVCEIREFGILKDKTQKRIVIKRSEFIFHASRIGILMPQLILIDSFRLGRRSSGIYRKARIEILYSEFSKRDVEVESKLPWPARSSLDFQIHRRFNRIRRNRVNQSDLQCLVRVNRLRGQEHFKRCRLSD